MYQITNYFKLKIINDPKRLPSRVVSKNKSIKGSFILEQFFFAK